MEDEKAASQEPQKPEQVSLIPALLLIAEKIMKGNEDFLREHNATQSKLWKLALIFEGAFIALVLFGGFIAVAVLACHGRPDSAEKIAFGLFGFIGGRGFLHIRGLMEGAAKNK